MRGRFASKVTIQNGEGYRGRIVIEYFNRSDLERICELLAPREQL
jgi:hypothetical protein